MIRPVSHPIDVRNMKDAKLAEQLVHTNRISIVLIYADWCGHCHNYMPQWKEFEHVPGRTANIMKVHHDMVENIPAIKHAKIQGYPSVIKVSPNGSIQEYDVEGSSEKTNAIPYMRNKKQMIDEITNNINDATVSNILPSALKRMKAGRRHRSFKSPKLTNRRGCTRKNKRN